MRRLVLSLAVVLVAALLATALVAGSPESSRSVTRASAAADGFVTPTATLPGSVPPTSTLPGAVPPGEAFTETAPTPPPARPSGRPNVVFVLADDLSMDLLRFMPAVQALARDGVSFSRHITSNSLCCPSRASILTGMLPHSTEIFSNGGPKGGFAGFRRRGLEERTFASALQDAGYRTALVGKYLNRYAPTKHGVPSGWTRWGVAGNGYNGFSYQLNVDGKLSGYGKARSDYMTDVLADQGVTFIDDAVDAGDPFALVVSTFAPHSPFVPAPRHRGRFPRLKAPRSPAFNRPNVDDARWLRRLPPLSAQNRQTINRKYRARARSVLAIDEALARLRRHLVARGVADNTYVVFGSDNGLHMGEHRMLPGKTTPFDTDVRVPLVIAGPNVRPGRTVDALTQNTDLAPTFARIGGTTMPGPIDGRDLLPWLEGQAPADWRDAALMEHRAGRGTIADPDLQPARAGAPPTYRALRTATGTYVEYASGERAFYDLRNDPHQRRNVVRRLPAARDQRLRQRLAQLSTCRGAACSTGPVAGSGRRLR